MSWMFSLWNEDIIKIYCSLFKCTVSTDLEIVIFRFDTKEAYKHAHSMGNQIVVTFLSAHEFFLYVNRMFFLPFWLLHTDCWMKFCLRFSFNEKRKHLNMAWFVPCEEGWLVSYNNMIYKFLGIKFIWKTARSTTILIHFVFAVSIFLIWMWHYSHFMWVRVHLRIA